ncbi:hypothetical protein H6G97_35670 [Nostoc flagelliforme FACHB-838]|uniref:Transposase n=1 Tax=Nostoc flagelliforme FACHB-838 TaxID=2692904 RepID=A0ABR8E1R9_9NOSO|nr:hypothetical protein [Nostoc flagelliforme]MBD2534538.1 hypothetical protein [Nostoc flagelliforme FACHB-838]
MDDLINVKDEISLVNLQCVLQMPIVEVWLGLLLGQTHLKYKNPLIARVSAFLNLTYFFVKILIQQGF